MHVVGGCMGCRFAFVVRTLRDTPRAPLHERVEAVTPESPH